MAGARNNVHITGIGMVNALGVGREDCWSGFREGRSGIGPVRDYDASCEPVQIAAEVPDFDAAFARNIRLPFRQRYARFTRLALFAGQEALQDSGLDLDREDRTRVGIVMGVGGGPVHYMGPIEEAIKTGNSDFDKILDHHFVVKTMLNAPTSMLSIRHHLEGPATTVSAACASGAHAIAMAMDWLQSGKVDIVLAGGTDATITKQTLLSYFRAGALSGSNELGAAACRPFDLGRNGFVMGEGAAVLVLESAEHARKRDAETYARLLGSSLVSEAYQLAAPRKEGTYMARTMQLALSDAGLEAGQIDHINAHAPSTPQGDAAEALAIKQVFGDSTARIAVSAPKSMMGHPIGASSAIQIGLTAMTIKHGLVTPTLNLENQDPAIDLEFVPRTAVEMPVSGAVCNAFGFGGHNASIVLGQ